jgi:hypothetical protein
VAFSAPLAEWSEPLPSGGGFRSVRVSERFEAKPPPPLEEARELVDHALRSARTEAAIRDALAKLRAQYELPTGEAQ